MWNRGIRILSVLIGAALVVAALWSFFALLTGTGFGPIRHSPQPLASTLFCVCHWTGFVLGFALLIRSSTLATYGIVGWAVFPLSTTVESLVHHWFGGPFQYRYFLLIAVPFAIATRQVRPRHLLPALGACCLVYLVKDLLLAKAGIREEPLWVIWLVGRDALGPLYLPTHGFVLGIGLLALGGWWAQERWLAVRARRRTPSATSA